MGRFSKRTEPSMFRTRTRRDERKKRGDNAFRATGAALRPSLHIYIGLTAVFVKYNFLNLERF